MGCAKSAPQEEEGKPPKKQGKKGKRSKHRRQKKSAPSLHLTGSQSQAGIVPPRESTELMDQSVLSDYEIKSPLGSGTFATVVLVHHKRSKRDLCLKMIDKQLLSARDEVDREMGGLKALCPHPKIVELVEVLEGQQAYFVLTEVLYGGDLFDRIQSMGGRVKEAAAAGYTRDLLQALTHMHALGWIHRDLKPENMLFADESDDSPLKVIDFGYATALEQGMQVTDGNLLGTPHYLAPEMAMQQPYNHKVDVWAAGVIAYQMVFGVLPWDDPELDEDFEDPQELWRRNKALLLRIDEAQMDCSGPLWGALSEEFGSFMDQVLCKDVSSRLDAQAALSHKWVSLSG